jgi:glycosyltransferase involved in cell wall biosynthesis
MATMSRKKQDPALPHISVMMSCYNSERYVARAIESILKQTYKGFEFLIADDRSTDGTLAIIERYAKRDKRIRVVRNAKNLGLTKTLNHLLGLARGEYLARMDADDECLAGRFAAQVSFLDKHPKVGVVGSRATIIGKDGRQIGTLDYALKDKEIRHSMLRRSQFAHPSVMFRKAVVDELGPYDERLRSAQDYEFFARVLTRWQGANLKERFLRYRWDLDHNEGFTHTKRQERNALRARWLMLTRYGWPWWQAIHLIKPTMSYLVPSAVKKAMLGRRIGKKH